MKNGKKSKHQK